MTKAPTNAGSAEVTAVDTLSRRPLLLLIGSGLAWLLVSGVLAILASIQLHSPQFLTDVSWLTFGRMQALRETAFVYGWAANAGLAIGLWVLGRVGGYPLRGLNWTVAGCVFWNLGVLAGLVGIATGDMTSFSFLQLPRYVQPLLVFAWAAMAVSGVLAWSDRKKDVLFASQWYAIAALFLFPWMLCAAQAVLLWWPVRGAVQAIGANWYAQGIWSLWLAPLALAGAYYIVPKVAGRLLPAYESAPLGFWTLIFLGSWTGGRHLVGGPVPTWVPTMAVVCASLLVFHYMVVALNFRIALQATGTAIRFIRVGLFAYLLTGVIELITSFRGTALHTQFTFFANAVEQLGLYGGISMMFFGAIYYLVPRLVGNTWASSGLASGHRVLVVSGVGLSVVALAAAGLSQGNNLLDASVSMPDIFGSLRTWLLVHTVAQAVLLGANFLLFVNFLRTACCVGATSAAPAPTLFRQPVKLEAHAS